jgi:hypothetical protein
MLSEIQSYTITCNTPKKIPININCLTPNEVELLIAIFSLLTLIAGAYLTLRRLKKQFEHRIIYEGWKKMQKQIFSISTCISEHNAKISWLRFSIKHQDNYLVNKGDLKSYRSAIYEDVCETYTKVLQNYTDFLKCFELHEFLFTDLNRAKNAMGDEFDRLKVVHNKFLEKVFPDQLGLKNNPIKGEGLERQISNYERQLFDITVYMIDLRILIQEETMGSVMRFRLIKRHPDPDHNILTRQGTTKQPKPSTMQKVKCWLGKHKTLNKRYDKNGNGFYKCNCGKKKAYVG